MEAVRNWDTMVYAECWGDQNYLDFSVNGTKVIVEFSAGKIFLKTAENGGI